MLFHVILKIFLSCLFGFLLSLSAPGYNLWFLAWFLLSPLFIIINTSKSIREKILYSFLFGLSYNSSYIYWLFSLHSLRLLGYDYFPSFHMPLLALLTIAGYYSLCFPLFAISIGLIKKVLFGPLSKGIPKLIIITLIWLVIFNKLSSIEQILGGFPWALIEYSQYKNLFLIQMVEYFGSVSISFLIVFFNLVLADFFIWLLNTRKKIVDSASRDNRELKVIVLEFSFILILISSSLIFGMFSYSKNEESFSSKSKKVCIVQGNLPRVVTKYRFEDMNIIRKSYSELSKNKESTLFVFPEVVLPTFYIRDLVTQNWLKALAKEKQAGIISGTFCSRNEKIFNCAVSYSTFTDQTSFYEKEKLAPFGETIPFYWVISKLVKQFKIKSSLKEGFAKGKQLAPIDTAIGKAGITICFESIFSEITRRQSLQGANLLIDLSNLKWFSNDLIKKQFLSYGVFRAIENRRPFIIATNNGISAFIEPNGKIKNQSLSNTEGTLISWINPRNKLTFYTKYAWW